jgi:GGDEF domain-containing protein
MRTTPAANSSRPGLLQAASDTPPQRAPQRRARDVAFSLRGVEPWIGWAIAGYSALLAMGAPHSEWLWLFVIHAGLVGKWAEMNPARRQLQLVGRALALLAGAFVLHGHGGAEPGGGADAYFVWLAVTTLGYAFMLRPAWAWTVLATAVTVYLLSRLGRPESETWAAMIGEIGFLCIVAPLAMRFGAAMRRDAMQLDEQMTDRATSLLNLAGLIQHGDELAASAHRERLPAALALFDCADLGVIYKEQGRAAGERARSLWIQRLQRLAGARGLVARTGPTEFAVLLHGLNADRAKRLIDREFGAPAWLELAGEDLVLAPQLLVEGVERGNPLAAVYDRLLQRLKPEAAEAEAAAPESVPMEERLLTRFDLDSMLSVIEYEGNGFAPTNVMTRPAPL